MDKVQASFMKELKEVNDKLKTSENAVAELRQMRCKCIFLVFLNKYLYLLSNDFEITHACLFDIFLRKLMNRNYYTSLKHMLRPKNIIGKICSWWKLIGSTRQLTDALVMKALKRELAFFSYVILGFLTRQIFENIDAILCVLELKYTNAQLKVWFRFWNINLMIVCDIKSSKVVRN